MNSSRRLRRKLRSIRSALSVHDDQGLAATVVRTGPGPGAMMGTFWPSATLFQVVG